MTRCPLTYESLGPGDPGPYSRAGLRGLAAGLEKLEPLPFTASELRFEAAARASKISIQGVQPKLSARLAVSRGSFEIVDRGGTFLLKPQSPDYPNLPENEDLTMHLAETVGIDVPVHGLILGKDGALTYAIRRFDRAARGRKLAVEDFAQLDGRTRETKYAASMERVASIIDDFATFPAVERLDLFVRTVFCFLTGNEDMHLKNFSLIEREGTRSLAPAYDLLSTTLALPAVSVEMALPLRGKKSRFTREDLVAYFGHERLKLPMSAIEPALERVARGAETWPDWIEKSFLPLEAKSRYVALIEERLKRLGM